MLVPPRPPARVIIEGVSKTYRTQTGLRPALKPLSLDLGAGEFVSILGPSGCGKSTLLLMVGGLIPPSTGRLLVNDTEVRGPQPDMGFVFQKPTLLPWLCVLDNILFPIALRHQAIEKFREEAATLVQMTQLEGAEHLLPAQLSGGMQQRVAICRALIHRPSLLLMDEPFGALDAITRDEMNQQLLRVWQRFGNTILFVTHSIREAVFLSDRVIVLSGHPGRLVLDQRIDLPRPRELTMQETPVFNTYVGYLRAAIAGESGSVPTSPAGAPVWTP